MSRAAGEVVTLQLGNYANYVGTHWWNLQESTFTYDRAAGSREVDHDVLFREGVTLGGEVTYTPRLIAYDLQCNVGSLCKQGSLYSSHAAGDTASVAWPAELVKRYVSSAADENEFLQDLRREDALATASAAARAPPDAAVASYRERVYDLDGAVRQWSDYLKVHLHPKTVSTISEYGAQGEGCEPFNVHGYGEQLYGRDKYATEVEDKLHFFTEECDYLQGFQLLCDTNDGFGGFASRAAALLAEEFPRRPAMAYCTLPAASCEPAVADGGDGGDDGLYRLVNDALSWCALCDSGACVVPLSLSDDPWLRRRRDAAVQLAHVRYRPDLAYHTSAVIAAALDTATLPYRIRDDGGRVGAVALGGLHGVLTEGGRRVGNVAVSLPFAMRPGEAFASALARCCAGGGACLGATSLLPKFRGSASLVPLVQSVVVRGVAGLDRRTLAADVERHLRAAGCGPTVCGFACVEQPCVLEPPYPRFFDASVQSDGRVSERRGDRSSGSSREQAATQPRPVATSSLSLPALASLQCSTESARLLRDLRGQLAATNFARLHRFADAGLERDDLTELLEKLDHLASAYYYDDDQMQ